MWRLSPVSRDTLVRISKKQFPYARSQHRNPAYVYKAFSKHTFYSHMATVPARWQIMVFSVRLYCFYDVLTVATHVYQHYYKGSGMPLAITMKGMVI
jgi:hypothetical protein